MTYFETGSAVVEGDPITIFEMFMESTATRFQFELRNDDNDAQGDNIETFTVQVKLHEDGEWLDVLTEADFPEKFVIASDDYVMLSCVVDSAYAVRFVATTDGGPQSIMMRGWYDAA